MTFGDVVKKAPLKTGPRRLVTKHADVERGPENDARRSPRYKSTLSFCFAFLAVASVRLTQAFAIVQLKELCGVALPIVGLLPIGQDRVRIVANQKLIGFSSALDVILIKQRFGAKGFGKK